MMKRLIMLSVFFSCMYIIAFSKTKNSAKFPSITLKVKVSGIDVKEGIKPYILLTVSAYPFVGSDFLNYKHVEYRQDVVIRENNVFKISAPSKTVYIQIHHNGREMSGASLMLHNTYIIQSGSNLTCDINEKQIRFSGKGSKIPNIQSKMTNFRYLKSLSDMKLMDEGNYAAYFKKMDQGLDSALFLQLKVIKQHREMLGNYYSKLLTSNCYGLRYYSQFSYDYSCIASSAFGAGWFEALKVYRGNQVEFGKKLSYSNEILAGSPVYSAYLLEELLLKERLQKFPMQFTETTYNSVIDQIDKKYQGILKDKLLTLLVLRVYPRTPAFTIKLLDRVTSLVIDPKYKKLLVEKQQYSLKGKPFFDFKLADSSGNIVQLSDFKDKVVFIDFWYTGCPGCAILSSRMPYVLEKFKDNPGVKFVTISIDKDKDSWITNGLKSGKYTHDGQLNLYTNGAGKEHPLIKHYNINSYPTKFLIKNGKMYAINPPDPRNGSEQEPNKGQDELIAMIKAALAEK